MQVNISLSHHWLMHNIFTAITLADAQYFTAPTSPNKQFCIAPVCGIIMQSGYLHIQITDNTGKEHVSGMPQCQPDYTKVI